MIGTAISAAIALGSAFIAHRQSSQQAKKAQKLNKRMEDENRADLMAGEYRNSLDSPTAKGQMENIRRQAERSNNMNDNRNIAGGMTQEAMLASKNATNNQVANAQNNVVASQESRQNAKDEAYMNRAMRLNARGQAAKNAEAQAYANLVSNFGDALRNTVGTLDSTGTSSSSSVKPSTDNGGLEVKNNIESATSSNPLIEGDSTSLNIVQPSNEFVYDDSTVPQQKKSSNGNFTWTSDMYNSMGGGQNWNQYLAKRKSMLGY